jgi:hypothetical protein
MMKKYFLIIALSFFGYHANAQILISLLFGDKLNSDKIEFGLEGGLDISNIQNQKNAKNLAGFNLGFYFDFKMKNPHWMLNTGVVVKSPMGAGELPVYSLNNVDLDNSFAGGSVKRRLRYFNVPILLKYKFDNNLFVKAGIEAGLLNKAFDEFSNTINDKNDLKHTINIKNQFHAIDAGLAFGIGYRLLKGKGMNIGIQYYLGLTDITKDNSGQAQQNRVFYLNAGIPIGKQKNQPAK